MERARRARIYAIAAITLVAGLIAVQALVARSGPRTLSWRALLDATYPVSIRPAGVTLHDGLYDVPAAPGSASRVVVRLADMAAFGDVDGTGDPDAAVVLVSSGGGSGTFAELSAVLNEAGVPHPLPAALLGDRVLVREVRVQDRTIVVRLRVRGATDPLTLRTQEVTRTYALDGARLVLRTETETQVDATPADAFVYETQRLDIAAGATRDVSATLRPGQIASYVVHGATRQVLDLRVRSEFDNAVLSVFGLSDGLQLVSRRDYAVERTVTLSTEQDYAVKVVSLAGQDLPFTLTVGVRAPAVTTTATPRPSDQPLPSRTPSPAASQSPRPGLIQHPLAEVSAAALAFARSRPPTWGVAVFVPAQGLVYAENADEQVPTASVVKVLVMLTVLEQARADHRPPSEAELALLWPMITESDNDATSELWERIGRGSAVAGYMASIGVSGFTPDPATSWGVSFVSARAMATALGKLLDGTILDETSRALAIKLLESVVPSQRWGVTAATEAGSGDRVGVKNGWYPGDEGWRVNSAGIVRPTGGTPYAIAVVTDGRPSWQEGIDTIEGIAGPINGALRGR